MNHRILIVIVLYKEVLTNSIALKTLKESILISDGYFRIYIHDNSPEKYEVIEDDVYYIHSKNNIGLSKAYNQAAEYARMNNFNWLLLSDQDTNYPIGILNDYIKAVENNLSIKLFVPIVRTINGFLFSPFKYKHKRGRPLKHITSGEHSLKGLSVINSGILINLDSFFSCGGYNEKAAIDFSDHLFIERLKKIESKFYLINKEIIQDFSNESTDNDKLYNRQIRIILTIKNCQRNNVFEKIEYFLFILRHTIALFYKTKQLRFIKCFFSYYICNKRIHENEE